jgi:phosphatidate cytidylyltransferase
MSDSVTEVIEPVPGDPPVNPKGDLGIRTVSAVVMVAVAGTALWLGGWVWAVFVALVALGVLWEWRGLVRGLSVPVLRRTLWIMSGVVYVASGSTMLVLLRNELEGVGRVLLIVGAVICTDIGAYFVGRTIGGPKIAPTISPSKTWAGLFGGMLGASLAVVAIATAWDADLCEAFYPRTTEFGLDGPCSGIVKMYPPSHFLLWAIVTGSLIAITAQAGDFFESWMKRRAGVKDSGKLLPGHGGLFDRVDGLIAVLFVIGLVGLLFNR